MSRAAPAAIMLLLLAQVAMVSSVAFRHGAAPIAFEDKHWNERRDLMRLGELCVVSDGKAYINHWKPREWQIGKDSGVVCDNAPPGVEEKRVGMLPSCDGQPWACKE